MRHKKWSSTVSPRVKGSSPVRGKFFAQFFVSNTILADLTMIYLRKNSINCHINKRLASTNKTIDKLGTLTSFSR